MLLRTLGGLKLQASDFYQTKPLLLLAYLAMEGAKERRHLWELFWPQAASPANSLRVALRVLNQNAPGVLEAEGMYLAARVQTDAQQLLSALDQNMPEQVLTLYHGLFLEGVDLTSSNSELEDWVYGTREFLAGRVRKAYLSFAESNLLEGRMESARTYAEYAYQRLGTPELDPEEIVRLHVLFMAVGSRFADELRREARDVNLTLTASAKLVGAKPASVAEKATAHNLPTVESSFVGRDSELLEITRLLAQSDCRLLTITGPGGTGKTRLALQAAWEELNKDGFGGGVFFVSLDAVGSPEQIPAHVVEALDLNVQSHETLLSLLVNYVGNRSVLLVLDNFEHLLKGIGLISELLKRCNNLKVITTSRERLDVTGEWVLPIEGLAVLGSPTDKDILHQDAMQLFIKRAKRARLSFSFTQEDLQDVLEICQLVQGSPLGIELAATWVRVLSCREIAREVRDNLDFLSVRTYDIVERHRSVRAVFESSWKLLSAREREVLSTLSVFRGGFRREAAGEVVGATIPVLASLIDKSLLRVFLNGRYDHHPLLYQYMLEKLAERPEEEARSRNNHGAYYIRFLTRRVEVEMFGPKHQQALAAIGEELENIRVAWRWMVVTATSENMQNPMMVTFAIQEFHDRRGRFREGFDLFDEAITGLDSANTLHHALLGNALVNQAYLVQRLAHYQEAEGLAQRGLELLRPLNEPWGIAIGLYTLGLVARYTGDMREAEGYFWEALSVTKVLQDNFGRAGTNSLLYALAAVQQALGNYPQAQEYAQEVLDLSRSQENYINVVRSLNTLGNLLAITGKVDEAQILLREALQLAQQMKFDDLIPQSLIYLAALSHNLGDDLQALIFNQDALLMAQKSGDKALATQALVNLGGLAAAQRDYTQAQNHLMQALRTTWANQGTPLVLTSLLHLADVWKEQGRFEQAARLANLVLHQPATEQYQRNQARLLLDTLRGRLPPETLKATQACRKTTKLNEVVTEMLATF